MGFDHVISPGTLNKSRKKYTHLILRIFCCVNNMAFLQISFSVVVRCWSLSPGLNKFKKKEIKKNKNQQKQMNKVPLVVYIVYTLHIMSLRLPLYSSVQYCRYLFHLTFFHFSIRRATIGCCFRSISMSPVSISQHKKKKKKKKQPFTVNNCVVHFVWHSHNCNEVLRIDVDFLPDKASGPDNRQYAKNFRAHIFFHLKKNIR